MSDVQPILKDDFQSMPGETEIDPGDVFQLIAFSVKEQFYGVEITAVREIRAWSGATPLPNTAPFVLGVINLRGAIVPILDLRARFGLGQTEPSETHVVVVLAIGTKMMGVLVDAVSDILSVTKQEIHEVPDSHEHDGQSLIEGIITHEERMVSMINLNVLSHGAVNI